MMMPANFSAISENEMTYVNGGASLADILAPELKVENWQKFNQNMVTIIGNSFMGKYIEQHCRRSVRRRLHVPVTLGNAWYTDVKGSYNAGYNAGFGKHENETAGDKFLNGGNGVLNAGLRMVGSAAAIYNLATGTVKNDASEKAWKVEF